jgi:ParB family chromosome partitioning protein
MSISTTKKLGRGLSALIADDYSEHGINVTDDSGNSGLKELALNSIKSGKFQPRSHFDEQYIQELAASISKSGVMQPIIVRPIEAEGTVRYEIIAGERRWRAAKVAGEITIPAIIRDLEDQQALELALIENVQRQDLSPLEEGRGYQRLMDEFSYTQEELSQTLGKSRSHIANLLRLLHLPQEVKDMLDRGDITMGHARALMNTQHPIEIARQVVSRGLNVRQTENIARELGIRPEANAIFQAKKAKEKLIANQATQQGERDPDIVAMEENLCKGLGLKVVIHDTGNQGTISLHYQSLEELDLILQRLGDGY